MRIPKMLSVGGMAVCESERQCKPLRRSYSAAPHLHIHNTPSITHSAFVRGITTQWFSRMTEYVSEEIFNAAPDKQFHWTHNTHTDATFRVGWVGTWEPNPSTRFFVRTEVLGSFILFFSVLGPENPIYAVRRQRVFSNIKIKIKSK